jgi:hypothetical protein
MADIVHVLRLVEYVGERSRVEEQIRKSVHGTRAGIQGVVITAQTLGEFPSLMDETSALKCALEQIDDLRAAMKEDKQRYEEALSEMQRADELYDAQGRPGEHDI